MGDKQVREVIFIWRRRSSSRITKRSTKQVKRWVEEENKSGVEHLQRTREELVYVKMVVDTVETVVKAEWLIKVLVMYNSKIQQYLYY